MTTHGPNQPNDAWFVLGWLAIAAAIGGTLYIVFNPVH